MRKWKTVWKELTVLETRTFGIPTGRCEGVIKLQEKPNRGAGFKYRAIYSRLDTPKFIFNVLDMDVFELSYPDVCDEYVIK